MSILVSLKPQTAHPFVYRYVWHSVSIMIVKVSFFVTKGLFQVFLGGFSDLHCDETQFWPNLWVLSWVFMGFMDLCIQTVNKVNTWTGFHHFTSQSMCSSPKIGV